MYVLIRHDVVVFRRVDSVLSFHRLRVYLE
jgi:hypothetical protein